MTLDKEAVAETMEETAERLMLPAVGKVAPAVWNEMVYDILSALRNEREHAEVERLRSKRPRIKEAALDEILDCDKCDLCEDHHD